MSDPVSQSDSDAVLASIRRLVLDRQDERAGTLTEPLILTAALRVDEGADDAAGAAGDRAFPPRSDDSGSAMDWQDADEATPAEEEQPAATANDRQGDLPDTPAAASLEETVIDEDFLRDIVSEIVREELQGALGERITRNVRKLVRREIHRALASRDFD